MVKKALMVAGGVVLLLGLFFGRDAASYVSTSVGWVKQSVKDSIPVEFEIERARKMIEKVDPEIAQNMRMVAKEEVEIEKLAKQVEGADEQLAKAKRDMLRLTAHVDSGDSLFYVGTRSYTTAQVKSDLKSRFDRYQVQEATHEKMTEILDARRRGLSAAQQKLEKMIAAKRQLEVDVANLEARLKMVQVAQTSSDFNFDDSQLSRTKELLSEIGTRIDVAEKMVNVEVQGGINLEEEVQEDISEEITRYFNGEKSNEHIVQLD